MRWEQRSTDRWWAYDAADAFVASVSEVVTAGGEERYWLAWRRDSSPAGVEVGRFDSATEGMAAVERSR